MKNKFYFLVTLLLAVCLMFSVTVFALAEGDGTTYYINSFTGNDENSGTSENAAWKSLSAHTDYDFQPGDRILLRAGGIYEGLFITQSSGTKENPIVLSSYGDTEADGLPVLTTPTTEHNLCFVNASNWIVENLEFTAPNGGGIHAQAINAHEEDIENYILSKKSDHIYGDFILYGE